MQVRRVRRDVVVLQLVDARRDVIVTNIVRLRVAEVTVRRIRQVHDRLIVAIRQALDIRRERLVDRTIRRRLVFRIDGKCCFVDFKVTLCLDDFVVDTCTILKADIFHVDSIFIRIWISICCRTTGLILSIAAARLDGKVTGALIELIVIDNSLACCAFLRAGERCSEFPVVDGCVAIGLTAAAVDVDLASENLDGAAILCGCIGVAARCALSCQVIVVRSGFDVVNSIIMVCSCFIAARTRCGLCPAFARERAAAIIVVGYVAFVEGICIFVDVMLFVILSGKGCLSGGRDISILQFFAVVFTVDFRHIVGSDIDGRLYLEDVLVLIVSCQVRIARCAPLRVCATVEVRAERIGIWRVGIDLPVAALAGRDGFLCRSQVLEGTICAACVDDNGIVIRRLSNQCTIIMGVIQYDCAALTRRRQVDLFMSRDTIDIDVARSLDIDALGISRDAVADCDVLARDADAFVRVDNTRVVLTAANCDIASVDLDILQGNRVTDVTSNVDFRIAGIDDEARMLQVLFLDETFDCLGTLHDIVPVGRRTEANRDHRARVVRLCFRMASPLRIAVIPLDVVVVNGRAIVVGEFRAFAIIGHAFWASDPIISVRILSVNRVVFVATATATDDQLILFWRAGQRVLKSRRDRSEIRIARLVRAIRRALSHCLGTGPSNRLPCQIRGKGALLIASQLIIGQDFSSPPICIPIYAARILADDLIIIRFDEVLPAFQTGRYPLIGVAGVDCAGDGNCTACAITLLRVKRQRTAVQADSHVAVEVDCAAIRRDFAVARLALIAEIRADRAGLNRRAAARRERTAIRRDIGVDEDGTEAIAIRIRMEVDIQRTRSRLDFRVDRDIALCLKRQGRICAARLIDGRIQCDGRDLIGIRCLYRNSRALIQQGVDGIAVDPCGLIAAGRARRIIAAAIVSLVILIALDSFTVSRSRARVRDDDLKRVEQPLACFAGLACCVDVDVIADLEIVAGGLDEAAVYCADCMERRSVLDVGLCADSLDRACTLPGLHAGCIKRAVQLDNAVIAAVQKDLTLLVLTQGLCLHRARVVDDRAHDIAGTPCRHDEIAAICLERTAVECLCLEVHRQR